MIEVIAKFDYIEPSKTEGFVKGYIFVYDNFDNKYLEDVNIYTDKYSFALYILCQFWSKDYKWNSIDIHFGSKVIELKGERIRG